MHGRCIRHGPLAGHASSHDGSADPVSKKGGAAQQSIYINLLKFMVSDLASGGIQGSEENTQ